jgi:hypothetical protein
MTYILFGGNPFLRTKTTFKVQIFDSIYQF